MANTAADNRSSLVSALSTLTGETRDEVVQVIVYDDRTEVARTLKREPWNVLYSSFLSYKGALSSLAQSCIFTVELAPQADAMVRRSKTNHWTRENKGAHPLDSEQYYELVYLREGRTETHVWSFYIDGGCYVGQSHADAMNPPLHPIGQALDLKMMAELADEFRRFSRWHERAECARKAGWTFERIEAEWFNLCDDEDYSAAWEALDNE